MYFQGKTNIHNNFTSVRGGIYVQPSAYGFGKFRGPCTSGFLIFFCRISSFRSVSGRTVAAFWWVASMIFIATYTANLAAFLTFNRMQVTIKSVEQLGAQMEVSYGTVRDSPIEEFFHTALI